MHKMPSQVFLDLCYEVFVRMPEIRPREEFEDCAEMYAWLRSAEKNAEAACIKSILRTLDRLEGKE